MHQLQQREKGADDFRAARGALKQFGEAHAAALGKDFQDAFDLFADGPFVLEDVALFEALQHAVDGVKQVENGNVRFRRGRGGFKFQFSRQARKNIFLLGFTNLQLRGGVLEFFIFDELADQFPARVFAFVLAFDDDLLIHWQEFAALDIHERRGHHEKFAGDLKIEFAHEVNVRDELRGELGEIDFVNIHFLLLDEIKQQV